MKSENVGPTLVSELMELENRIFDLINLAKSAPDTAAESDRLLEEKRELVEAVKKLIAGIDDEETDGECEGQYDISDLEHLRKLVAKSEAMEGA